MFGLGPTELIVILVLALILLGPTKLPQVATGLGKAIRQFRKATRDLGSQLDIDDEVKAPFRELRAAMRDEPAPYVPPPPPANTVAAVAPVVAAAATPPAESSGIAPVTPTAAKPPESKPETVTEPARAPAAPTTKVG